MIQWVMCAGLVLDVEVCRYTLIININISRIVDKAITELTISSHSMA